MTNIPPTKPLPKGFLKYGAAGLDDVEQAKRDMIAAKEPARTTRGGVRVPSFIQHGEPQDSNVQVEEIVDEIAALESAPVPPVQPVRTPVRTPVQAVQPEAQEPPQKEPTPAEQQIQKIETEDFTASIFRDAHLGWVGEIVYKNGAGTERFTGKNKDELLQRLLKGKAHSTLKIRQLSGRLSESFAPDTWDDFYAQLKETQNMTRAQFEALPSPSQKAIQDTIFSGEASEFLQATPEYYPTLANFKIMGDYLNRQRWPLTAKNLKYAFRELTDKGKLETSTAVSTAAPSSAPTAATIPAPPPFSPVRETPVVAAPRKRGTTGLIPGSSSASSSESRKPATGQEISEQAAKTMPLSELRRAAIPSLSRGGRK
jgi:hypothetical protein